MEARSTDRKLNEVERRLDRMERGLDHLSEDRKREAREVVKLEPKEVFQETRSGKESPDEDFGLRTWEIGLEWRT
jgi:hypothetical protein